MAHRLSKIIAGFFLQKKYIPEEEFEIYVYGYETIILSIIDFIIVMIAGIVFDKLFTMLVFFTMFITVRLYSGGYHANTVLKCKSIFFSLCIIMIIVSDFELPYVLNILIMILYCITSFFIAPVENYNKPLTDDEKKKYRIISIAMSLFWSIVAIISCFFAVEICTTITVTALYVTLLMIIGKFGKEANPDEKQ